MMYWLCGYLLIQVLLTNVPLFFLDMFVFALKPLCTHGNVKLTRLWYQQFCNLERVGGWSIIVTNIKSITVLSLPFSVYGPMRSTHNASKGVVMVSFAGSFPYLWFLHLFTWQLWHFWHVIGLSFIDLSNTSREDGFLKMCRPWVLKNMGYHATARCCRLVGITILPS